jgi:hypothetical protein
MENNLKLVLTHIAEAYKGSISQNSRHYREVDIGDVAARLGFADVKEKFKNARAIVPLQNPVSGMKVLIDGRTFVDYAQYDSGVAVPGYIAKEAGIPYKAYTPDESMILNFA